MADTSNSFEVKVDTAAETFNESSPTDNADNPPQEDNPVPKDSESLNSNLLVQDNDNDFSESPDSPPQKPYNGKRTVKTALTTMMEDPESLKDPKVLEQFVRKLLRRWESEFETGDLDKVQPDPLVAMSKCSLTFKYVTFSIKDLLKVSEVKERESGDLGGGFGGANNQLPIIRRF